MFISDDLYPLVQFPSINTNTETTDYQLEVTENDNYYVPAYYKITPQSYYAPFVVMYSDHNTLGVFTPLSRIVLTSQSLQIATESVQPSTPLFNSLTPNSVTQVANQQIITDFQPDFSTHNSVNRDFIQFNNSLVNSRLIPFNGNRTQLKRIDITVWWSDKNNNMYPLLLYPNTSFDIKICFVKKEISF